MRHHRNHKRKHSNECAKELAASNNIHQNSTASKLISPNKPNELNKLIDEEMLNLIQNEFEHNEEKTLLIKNAMNYYKDCIDNANKKMLLINQLPRKPSKESLEQFTFLQEIISKEYEFYCKAWETEEGMGNIMHCLFDSQVNALKQSLSKDTTPSAANVISEDTDNSKSDLTASSFSKR